MTNLLQENHVFYTFDQKSAPDYFLPFNYDRLHKGVKVDTNIVFCRNAHQFIKLIRYWNNKSEDWSYLLT